MASNTERELIIVSSDWKIQDVANKSFGQCIIHVSPPYNFMSFKRGFTLPMPNHQRCAVFSLIMAMELIESIPVEEGKEAEFVISTKHKWVYDTLNEKKVTKWETRGWPKEAAHMRGLLVRARDTLESLPKNCTLVYIHREKGDEARINLTPEDEMKNGGVDADAITKNGGGKDEIEKALRDMRMRNVMVDELLASGARASRAARRVPKAKK